jgi:hypothetical protein
MSTTRRRPLGEIGNSLRSNDTLKRTNSSSFVARPQSPRADEKNRLNPLFAVEYVKEIMENLKREECQYRPSPFYMSTLQTDINEKMRTILVDWLVDVHLKFRLLPETLFLAVDLIDRFLDKKVVNRQKLQLVGVVAMLLAAKYEEIFPPEVKDFIYIAANTYSRDDILRMERLMLQTLDFKLTTPTIFVFLERGLQVMFADVKTCHMAHFLAELALTEYKMLAFTPSMLASTSIFLANKLCASSDPWNQQLDHYMAYKASDLERCFQDLVLLLRSSQCLKTQAVRKKFSHPKFSEVSKNLSLSLLDPDLH